MERVALFAGSFDPFTIGHQDIVIRALSLFDRVVVAIGENDAKRTLFPLESRLAMICDTFAGNMRVQVANYEGLTADFCRKVGAKFIIRGLRSGTDFDYERTIAQANSMLAPEIETLFLVTRKEHAPIASTVVRDVIIHGGDVRPFMPAEIDLSRYPQNPR
jgi:pantetheine-phosphate adenylyltransferase